MDKLATKVIEIGGGQAVMYPGNYEEFLWSRKNQQAASANAAQQRTTGASVATPSRGSAGAKAPAAQHKQAAAESVRPQPAGNGQDAPAAYDERKRLESEARRVKKALDARRKRVDELEARIAEREQAIRDIETTMSADGFYDDHEAAKPVIAKHQALMWEVGDLMHQWEMLQQSES